MSTYIPKNLSPEDADAIASSVLRCVDAMIDAVARRLANSLKVQSRVAQTASPRLLTYAQASERIGRTVRAVQSMVYRKELRAVHPLGGRRAYIYERDLEDYVERSRVGSTRR